MKDMSWLDMINNVGHLRSLLQLERFEFLDEALEGEYVYQRHFYSTNSNWTNLGLVQELF
jgi:hypothetical protein